jgi:hypothetical protein
MGIRRTLIRLCFGMEEVEDLKRDLQQALDAMDSGKSSAVPPRREACDVTS